MPQTIRSLHLFALTLIVWVVGGISFFPAPEGVPSTYAAVLALFTGAVWVTFLTWRNAMSPDTVANLIHRTDSEPIRGTKPRC